jgi:aromatic-L-amino-acid/L-tryptophan decarboxylase
MVELIKECYSDTEKPVHPDPKPGFLRHVLPEDAPLEGQSIEHLMERTKNAIVPGIMNWQSPKYFGYYPSSVNVTSVLAEMFATTFQTPNFSYAVAPSFTELENTMMDWSAKALGLP